MDIEEIKTWIQWGIQWGISWIPSGKLSHNYGKPTVLMGKVTISMTIFNSYVSLQEGIFWDILDCFFKWAWEFSDNGCLEDHRGR